MRNMGERVVNRSRSRKGFSLAELLMVVAIIGILAVFGFLAVSQHQKNMKLSEMDNTAREIFVAAQNNLTASASTGEWAKLYSQYSSDTSESSYLGADASDVIAEASDLPDDLTADDVEDSSLHDFRVLVHAMDEEVADEDSSALGLMLLMGAIDETVRTNGSYLIEYDALTATVYGVFYTDSADLVIDPDDSTQSDEVLLNDGRTDSSVRIDYTTVNGVETTVGYYGGASAEEASYSSSSDTTMEYTLSDPTLEFANGDTLQLILVDPNLASLATQYTDNSGEEYTYTVTVTLSDAHGNEVTLVPLTASDGGTTFCSGDSSDASGQDAAYDSTAGGYVYTLDSILSGSYNYHFGAQFADLYLGDELSATAQAVVTWNDGDSSDTVNVESSNTANSLFDDDTSGSAAEISNIRHLENLSTVISGIDSTDSEINTDTITSAVITDDLDWATWSEDNLSSSSITTLGGTSSGTTYYVGIINDSLTSLTGDLGDDDSTAPTLSDFTIDVAEDFKEDSDDPTGAGLIASTDHRIKISNLTLAGFSVIDDGVSDSTEYSLGALIGAASLDSSSISISDITISDSTVTASSDSDSDTYISGSNAGYLIGSMNEGEDPAGSITIDGCTLNVTSGTMLAEDAGGFVGYVTADSLSVTDSDINGDDTNQYTISGSNAGGFIGRVDDCTIVISDVNMANTVDLSVEGIDTDDSAACAGGCIGAVTVTDTDSEASTLNISSCTANGTLSIGTDSADTENTNTTTNAGGVLGLASGATVTMKSVAVSADTLTVTAESAAGGLVGDVAEDSATDLAFTISSCSITETDDVAITASADDTGSAGGIVGCIAEGIPVADTGTTMSGAYTVHILDSTISADNLVVTGDRLSGGLAGYISGQTTTISGCTIEALTAYMITVSGVEEEDYYSAAGGLVGFLNTPSTGADSSAAAVTVTDCSVGMADSSTGTFTVSGAYYAGGLVGLSCPAYPDTDVAASISSSYNYTDCTVTAGTNDGSGSNGNIAGTMAAGGLVGDVVLSADASYSCDQAFEGCISDARVTASGMNASAGGLIGLIGWKPSTSDTAEVSCIVGSAVLESCYSAGHTSSGEYTEDNISASAGSAGGLIGTIGADNVDDNYDSYAVVIEECYTTCSVSGGTYVGGFIGSALSNDTSTGEVSTTGLGTLTLTGTYSTGLISQAQTSAVAGLYIGGIADTVSNGTYTTAYTDNYCLDNVSEAGIDAVGTYYGTETDIASIADGDTEDGPFGVEEDSQASADPYDDLGSTYPYMTCSQLLSAYGTSNQDSVSDTDIVPSTHVGDWPVPTAKFDTALIYYEYVDYNSADSTTDGGNFYYTGYAYKNHSSLELNTTTTTYTENNISLASAIDDTAYQPGDDGLLSDESLTNSQYVTADGYYLIIQTGVSFTVTYRGSTISLTEDDTILGALNLDSDTYDAYLVPATVYTEASSGPIDDPYSFKVTYGSSEDQYYAQPYFADCLAVDSTAMPDPVDGTFEIRSADQLYYLFNYGISVDGTLTPGGYYLDGTNGYITIRQTMDIDMDLLDDDFTISGSYLFRDNTMHGVYTGLASSTATRTHAIDNMTVGLFEGVDSYTDTDDSTTYAGTVEYLSMDTMTGSYVFGAVGYGDINNITLSDATMTSMVATSDSDYAKYSDITYTTVTASGAAGLIADSDPQFATIDTVTITGSVFAQTGIAQTVPSGSTVNAVTMTSSYIAYADDGNGIADTNAGTIENCVISSSYIATNSSITGNGIAYTNSGSILDCDITGTNIATSTYDVGNGIAYTNEGTISGCDLSGVRIANYSYSYGNGIAYTNSGTVTGCSITSTDSITTAIGYSSNISTPSNGIASVNTGTIYKNELNGIKILNGEGIVNENDDGGVVQANTVEEVTLGTYNGTYISNGVCATNYGNIGGYDTESSTSLGNTVDTCTFLRGNGCLSYNYGYVGYNTVSDCTFTYRTITTGSNYWVISTYGNGFAAINGDYDSNQSQEAISEGDTDTEQYVDTVVMEYNNVKYTGSTSAEVARGFLAFNYGSLIGNTVDGDTTDTTNANLVCDSFGMLAFNFGYVDSNTLKNCTVGFTAFMDSNGPENEHTSYDCFNISEPYVRSVDTSTNLSTDEKRLLVTNNVVQNVVSGSHGFSAHNGQYFVGEDSDETLGGKIIGNTMTDCTISKVGFVQYNYGGCLLQDNEVIDSQVSWNGFNDLNWGYILNCQVYGTDYDEMTVGVGSTTLDSQSNQYLSTVGNYGRAGFIAANYGTVAGSSFTGTVCGRTWVAGFTLYNKGTIEDCYANAQVYVTDAGLAYTDFTKTTTLSVEAAFCNTLASAGTITNCHTLGALYRASIATDGTTTSIDQDQVSQSGFVRNTDSSSVTITNCYSAVWYMDGVETDSSADDIFMTDTDSVSLGTDYVLDLTGYSDSDTDSDITVSMPDDYTTDYNAHSVTTVTPEELAALTSDGTLGAAASATVAYNLSSTYPYPENYEYEMSDADTTSKAAESTTDTMTAYGDWVYFDTLYNIYDSSCTDITGTTQTETVGDTFTLTAGYSSDSLLSVDWTSSDTDVATIDSDGNVTVVSAGSVTFTATYSSVTATVTYTMLEPIYIYDSSGTDITDTEQTAAVDDTFTLTAGYSADSLLSVSWSSDDTSVATIDSDGNVTVVSTGEVTFTATYSSVTATVTYEMTAPIYIYDSSGTDITGTTQTETVGDTFTLTAGYSSASSLFVTWTSSDTSVATIDSDGNVTVVSAGSVNFTATYSTQTATVKYTMTAPIHIYDSSGTDITGTDQTETVGDTFTLTAGYSSASSLSVTWTSSDTSVVTIDSDGNVTVVSDGDVTFTATYSTQTASVDYTMYTSIYIFNSVGTDITGLSLQATVDDSFDLYAVDITGTEITVEWSSNDASVATIDSNGTVTAVSAGSVIFTATYESTAADSTVTASVTYTIVSYSDLTSVFKKIQQVGSTSLDYLDDEELWEYTVSYKPNAAGVDVTITSVIYRVTLASPGCYYADVLTSPSATTKNRFYANTGNPTELLIEVDNTLSNSAADNNRFTLYIYGPYKTGLIPESIEVVSVTYE